MLSADRSGCGVERGAIEDARVVEHARAAQRAGFGPCQDAVLVGARGGVAARVEAVGATQLATTDSSSRTFPVSARDRRAGSIVPR